MAWVWVVRKGRHTFTRHLAHKIYPYLLRNLTVDRPNQLWAMDITHIPMKKGCMYMIAIIDLGSINNQISDQKYIQQLKRAA